MRGMPAISRPARSTEERLSTVTTPKRWRSNIAPKAARKAATNIAVAVLVLGGACACGSDDGERIPDADHVAVCVHKETRERLPDEECEEERVRTGGGGWFYVPMGGRGSTVQAPAVGSRVTTGSFSPPPGASVARGGIPAQGGAVVRGGFGGGTGSVGG
jgi:hypothetical protein